MRSFTNACFCFCESFVHSMWYWNSRSVLRLCGCVLLRVIFMFFST